MRCATRGRIFFGTSEIIVANSIIDGSFLRDVRRQNETLSRAISSTGNIDTHRPIHEMKQFIFYTLYLILEYDLKI